MTDCCSAVNSGCVVTARRRWCVHTADFIELGKAANRCLRDSSGSEAKCSYSRATSGDSAAAACGARGEVLLGHQRRHLLRDGGVDQLIDRDSLALGQLAELAVERLRQTKAQCGHWISCRNAHHGPAGADACGLACGTPAATTE